MNEKEIQELRAYNEGRKSLKSVTDPRFNMYFMKTRCSACGAAAGHTLPISQTFTRGMTLTPSPGSKGIATCIRCGKAAMVVVNDPPKQETIKRPRGWNTSPSWTRTTGPFSPGRDPDDGDTPRLKI